jgi:hypothetical protein
MSIYGAKDTEKLASLKKPNPAPAPAAASTGTPFGQAGSAKDTKAKQQAAELGTPFGQAGSAAAKALGTPFGQAGGNGSGHIGTPFGQAPSSTPQKILSVESTKFSNVVAATPITPAPAITPTVNQSVTQSIKTATPDIILFDDDLVPINIMTDLVFENIGGQELINIGRNDIINGQNVVYQPIKNLSLIQQQYNPNNIIGIQETSDKYFAGFSIKFESKIPDYPNEPDRENVYMDTVNGNIVIELISILPDEQVEVQIITSGTIYEVIL